VGAANAFKQRGSRRTRVRNLSTRLRNSGNGARFQLCAGAEGCFARNLRSHFNGLVPLDRPVVHVAGLAEQAQSAERFGQFHSVVGFSILQEPREFGEVHR
jgi:hypothetical protein